MARYSFRDLVIDARTGLNPRKNFILGSGSNYYITIKDIHNGRIVITDKTDRIDDAAIAMIKKRSRIQIGDVLFTSIGRIGETAIVWEKDDSWDVNESVFIFTLNAKIIMQEYFCLLFLSHKIQEQLQRDSSGSTFKSIKMNQLERMEFSIPTLGIQQEITYKLKQIYNLIFFREQQLVKLDELVKTRFVEMFGTLGETDYSIRTLDELCVFIKDGTHQTPQYTEDTLNGVKFLSSKDVTSGQIDWTKVKYIPQELHEELYARIAPRRGDVLLAKNGTTGIPAIVDTDDIFDIYVSLALLRFKPGNNITYLWAALSALETKKQFDASLKGIGVPNLHLSEIKKTKVIVPPIEFQNEFANFIDGIKKSKLTIQHSLDKLETLKKSLMQQYFG